MPQATSRVERKEMKNAAWHARSTSTDESEMSSGDDHVIKVLDRHVEIRVHPPAAPLTSFTMLGISLCCSIKPRQYFLNAQESREAEFLKHPRCPVGPKEARWGQQTPSTPRPRATSHGLLGSVAAWDGTTAAGTGQRIPSQEISSGKLNPRRCEGNRFQSQTKYKMQEACLRSWQVCNASEGQCCKL